jgi:phospholipase/lecithinase/hemolysin
MKKTTQWLATLLMLSSMAGSSPVKAQAPFSGIAVFGDSISDTGNFFLATDGLVAGPPYYEGRFCNGPLWIDVLAEKLGLPAPVPSLGGGANYAWGGAGAGSGLSFHGAPNLGMQIDFFAAERGGFAGDELVVVAAGSNDLLWQAPFSPAQITHNISQHVSRLAAAGATTFLIPNIVPLGETPLFRQTPAKVRFNTLAIELNRLLDQRLNELAQTHSVTILRLDMAGLISAMLGRPGDFGITNVTEPACPGCGLGIPDTHAGETVVPSQDEYLWWDWIHPSQVAHRTFGEAAAGVVGAASLVRLGR